LLGVFTPMRVAPGHWGYALFPESRDWTVRTYSRTFEVGSDREAPSLFEVAVEAYCSGQSSPQCAETKEHAKRELEVSVARARYDVPILPVEDMYPVGRTRTVSSDNPLAGKIAILGGTYSPSDRHATPWGVVNGVELVSYAIESE